MVPSCLAKAHASEHHYSDEKGSRLVARGKPRVRRWLADSMPHGYYVKDSRVMALSQMKTLVSFWTNFLSETS